MKIFKIWCEWEMPIAHGHFKTKEEAQKAINEEDWEMCGHTLDSVQKDGLVSIEKIILK